MSQDKTRVPGMEPEQRRKGGGQHRNVDSQGFYSRSANRPARGTVVPGMDDGYTVPSGGVGNDGTTQESVNPQRRTTVQSGKPVVGFLYSISRTAAGEFWPLQVGRNSIGRTGDCDVRLAEATVSGRHAEITIQRNKKTGALIAGLKDVGSKLGTLVNGDFIGFDPTSCESGDIIAIGDSYELVLIILDPTKYQLSVSKNFIPVDDEEEGDDEYTPDFGGHGGTRGGGFDPYSEGPTNWNSTNGTGDGYEQPASPGTVGMDGTAGFNKGGTRPI